MMHQLYGDTNFDIAARKHKKHKIKISGLVISISYNEELSNFRLFTSPSIFKKSFNHIAGFWCRFARLQTS
jgi:hypothetical protein